MSITVQSTTDPVEPTNAIPSEGADVETQDQEVVETKAAESEDSESENEEESATSSETEEEEQSEEDEESEEDSENDEEEEAEEPKKTKKSGFKKRIDKLNSRLSEKDLRLSEKDREIEYWKAKALEDAKKESAPQETKTHQDQETDSDKKPDPDDFENHDDYVEALTDWKIDQREKAKTIEQKEADLKKKQAEKVETFRAKIQEFQKSVDDFEEVVNSVNDVKITPVMDALLVNSQIGPEMMYYLASNREALEQLNSLDPYEASKQFGIIEHKLKQSQNNKDEQSEKPKKTITKAPKPIEKVTAKATKVSTSIYDANSQRDYEAARREQLKKKRGF